MESGAGPALRQEPYRLLFPLGLICAAVGLGVWIPYYLFPEALPYPGSSHAAIQIQGFLLCFVFGFLGTMMPKVLGVRPLGPIQFWIFPAGLAGIVAAALADAGRLAQGLHLLLLLNFALFIARRWPTRAGNPPSPFVFIALAMVADLAGTVLRILPPAWTGAGYRLGAMLQYQAFPLLLILGVGGFLLPKLFGAQNLDPAAFRREPRADLGIFLPLGLLFLASFGWEAYAPSDGGPRAAAALRAAIWTWFGIRLRIWQPARLPAYLAGARIALIAIGAGLLLPALLPVYRLAWEHLVFITGLMWLTLAIASRVVTAHGGRLDLLEKSRKSVLAYGWLMAVAALTRVTTDIWTGGRWLHLALASAFALTALGIWARLYLPLVRILPAQKGAR